MRQGATLRSVNAVRCVLVLGLITFQSIEVSESYGRVVDTALWVVPGWTVAALFALAGFTTMRSVDRNGAATAALRTAVRFLPGLVLVVIATGYGLGLVVTADSRQSYLLDPDVAAYLLNIVGIPQYSLPGVFQFNAAAGIVNPVLWTVSVACLAAVMMLAMKRSGRLTTRLLAGGSAILATVGVALFIAGVDLGMPDGLLALLLAGKGLCALLSFAIGALFYRLRAVMPIDWRVATAAGIVAVLVALLGNRSWLDNALVSAGAALPIAYLAIYACSLPWPLRHRAPRAEPVLWRMLLIAYPVQQACVAFGPGRQNAAVNLALSLPVIAALSTALWLLVEQPLLRRLFPTVLPTRAAVPGPKHRTASEVVAHARATLPLIVGAVFVVLLVLAALALTMFAMQRDTGGA